MEPFSILALGSSVFGSVSSYFGKQDQAARIRAQTEEQVRRLEAEQQQQLGAARAAGAASGADFESTSIQRHLANMAEEFRRQVNFTRRAGMNQASDVSAAGTLGLFSDLGGSLFSFGKANNWWRQPGGGVK